MEDDEDNDDDLLAMLHLKELMVLITGSTYNRYIRLDDEEVNEEAVKHWFTQLNEEIKMTTSGIDYQVKGQTFIVPQLLKLLHQAFLSHHWSDAVQILETLAYEPKGTTETLWRAGMEVLYSNPQENDAFISQLFRQLKVLKELHVQDVVLEYILYLLSHGRVHDAAAVVKQKDKRSAGMEKSVALPAHSPAVYRAYRGLVYYVEWLMLKHQTQEHDSDMGDSWQTSSQANYRSMQMSQLAQQAITLMDGVVEEPGVWDIFVLKLVQLKEEYEGPGPAKDVLTRYRDQNPDNPNCHRYLYQFLLSHGSRQQEEIIRVLKELAKCDPSNPLVLHLCSLIAESPSVACYLFDLLDFCNWREDAKAWKMMRKHLVKYFPSDWPDHAKVIEQCWAERSTWWPPYHFVVKHLDKSDTAVLFEKAVCAYKLLGKENAFTENCLPYLNDKNRQRLLKLQSDLT